MLADLEDHRHGAEITTAGGAEGCDVVTVQHALGHSTPSITLDIYSHLWPKAEDRTRRASGNLISAAFAGSAENFAGRVRDA